ncbi:MAG: cysteine desulfurase family protein [Hyphomicrobiales bacterium]|nr:cysteine desulfurase family protein [Hyphomicrobiales bacterium]
MTRVYLDHNASSPLRPEARAAMIAAMDACGNPSSIHAEGRAARAIMEGAREKIARAMGARPANVIFTSGGTEAANAAIFAARQALGGATVLAGAAEHPCVLKRADQRLAVSADGVIDMRRLRAEVSGAAVIALQDANNETGVRQPLGAVAELALERGALFICDAVQTAGRVGVSDNSRRADMVFISAHKFGGPQGAGAIILNRDMPFDALLSGGGQERGQRGGTENVAAIAGTAAALEAAEADRERFAAWAAAAQRRLESALRSIAPDTVIFGDGAPRIPNTTCFAAPGVSAEIALMALDLEGVAVSSGSACSSGKVAPSHVLAAMGTAPDLAKCAIRVSTGWNTTEADIDRFLEVWEKIYARLRPRAAA